MKHTILFHSAWGLVAAAAFTGGFFFAAERARQASAGNADPTAGPPLLAPAGLSALPSAEGAKGQDDGKGGERKADGGAAGTLVGRPLSAEQVHALAKEAFNDPNPLTRNIAFSKLLESMTPDNVMLVMEAMEENRADGDQWRLFRYAWGAMDGEGVIALASSLEGDRKRRFLSEAISGWASKDPTAALAWLDTQEAGDEKNRFTWSLVGGLADHDIGMATDYVYKLANSGNKQAMGYLESVASEELRKNGTAAATLWAERLPDGPLKGAALDRVAGSFVRENPEAAASWAEKFADADFGARVIEEVGDEWAERDPVAAVNWLQSLPEGNGRSEGMYSAFREWTQRDSLAASEYLAAMPPSETKDSAVSGFARTLAYEDPESAIIWARTIANEESRVQSLTRAGQAWFRRDPGAAAVWLQTANLPVESHRAILAPSRDRRR